MRCETSKRFYMFYTVILLNTLERVETTYMEKGVQGFLDRDDTI